MLSGILCQEDVELPFACTITEITRRGCRRCMIGGSIVAGGASAEILDRATLGVHCCAVALAAGCLRRAVGRPGRDRMAVSAVAGQRPGRGVMRRALMTIGADAGGADALVADGAVTAGGGQWTIGAIVMVELGHRQSVAGRAGCAVQRNRAVAILARLGCNGGSDENCLIMMPVIRDGGAFGVAPGAGGVSRCRVDVAPRAIPRQVGICGVMLRDDGWLAGADMTG